MDVEELTKVLRDVNKGRLSETKALEEIKKVSPLELSMAEERLLMEGVDDKHMNRFCQTHLKSISKKLKDVRKRLDEDHPLSRLMEEHDRIIEALDDLDYLAGIMEERDLTREEIKELKGTVQILVEKEKHHDREEELIFPEIRKKGVKISVDDLIEDHEEFQPKTEKLTELSKEPNKYKSDIVELIYHLSFNIRRHVFKENNMVYPAVLKEVSSWDSIAVESEKIGYCKFTKVDRPV